MGKAAVRSRNFGAQDESTLIQKTFRRIERVDSGRDTFEFRLDVDFAPGYLHGKSTRQIMLCVPLIRLRHRVWPTMALSTHVPLLAHSYPLIS